MNKAVIFDLDGTLLDTIYDITDKVNSAMTNFGYPTLTVPEVIKRICYGTKDLIKQCINEEVSEQRLQDVLNFFLDIYANAGDPKTKPFNGILEVLNTLIERGYKLAIVTNKPQTVTDKICKQTLSQIPFEKIIGQSSSVICKPHPTATLNLLNELNVMPKNAYFVGDGETDYLVAKNANINSICVLWGYRTKEQLQQVGATVFANNPQDLLKLIP